MSKNALQSVRPSSRLYFAGDPHGQLHPIEMLARREPDAVFLLLGDCDLAVPLEQAIPSAAASTWWIHGNHDCDRIEYYDRLFGSALTDRCLHGRVFDIGGLRVAGLGGVFREKVWHPETGVRFASPADYLHAIPPRDRWRGGLPCRHRASIWFSDYQALWDQRADILVTHEAPSCHRHGFAVIDELAEAMGVRLAVHGHHHETYRSGLASGITVQGVGLAEVVDLEGNVVARPRRRQTKATRRRGTRSSDMHSDIAINTIDSG